MGICHKWMALTQICVVDGNLLDLIGLDRVVLYVELGVEFLCLDQVEEKNYLPTRHAN